jgi:hypothetical protein
MAANPNFLKVLTDVVELKHPKLDQPYRFNPQAQRSDPCAATAQGAAYSVQWVMSRDDAKVLYKMCEQHFAERKAAGEKIGTFTTVFGMKKQDDGTVSFTAKRNATKGDGTPATPPHVIGLDLQELPDKRIWSGSKGKIRALAFPTKNGTTGEHGISLMLDTVQVTEAVYGGDNLADDFGPPQRAASTPADPFADDLAPAKAGAAGPGLERDVPTFEDDLPF